MWYSFGGLVDVEKIRDDGDIWFIEQVVTKDFPVILWDTKEEAITALSLGKSRKIGELNRKLVELRDKNE